MPKSRRKFLADTSLGLLAAALPAGAASAMCTKSQGAQTAQASAVTPSATPQGTPSAFATSPPAGPPVSAATFAEAEKLVQVTMTEAHRTQAATSWLQTTAGLLERRTGPRRLALDEDDAPATVWNPVLPGMIAGPATEAFVVSEQHPPRLPERDEDIAFAPVNSLAAWVRSRQISSERLTRIYLDRLKRFNGKLNCVITLTEDHALAQARAADAEIAAGRYRGPLHGIPWGAKDLLDTAGIRTTWGAEPFRTRVPAEDATVTARLNAAGAVLVAKLSLGALASNDIWFGGQTMNPWLLQEGSSGSSAGPGAAVAAGLVAFAIGSDTQGSIISPSMRCGVTGLRPTFGRVPRTGAMTVSWTCDKLGAMARSVEDTMLVLHAIAGPDGRDVACVPAKLNFRANENLKHLRVGYIPAWMKEAPATEVDRHALQVLQQLGMKAVPVSLPDWPYDSLNTILLAESAAAFEKITLDHEVDAMRMQTADGWPNVLRQSRFISAIDFVQADRMRRKVAEQVARVFGLVDLMLAPSLRDEPLVIFSFTGNPTVTLRAGFERVSQARSDWAPDPAHPLPTFAPPRRVPYGVTLVGPLFEEGRLGAAGMALERALDVAAERPPGF